MPICEDIWQEPVCAHLAEAGAEMLLVPNGSPTSSTRTICASGWCASRVTETGLPLVYLNRVGGQDELVFDGSSLRHATATASWSCRCPTGRRRWLLTDWDRDARRLALRDPARARSSIAYPEDIYRAMMVALARLCRRATAFPA